MQATLNTTLTQFVEHLKRCVQLDYVVTCDLYVTNNLQKEIYT